jgi:hypothetical protein
MRAATLPFMTEIAPARPGGGSLGYLVFPRRPAQSAVGHILRYVFHTHWLGYFVPGTTVLADHPEGKQRTDLPSALQKRNGPRQLRNDRWRVYF